jgi:Domain of unknown function (DUF397)
VSSDLSDSNPTEEMTLDLSRITWRKSSRSGTNGCVEVAFAEDQVAVRDSKDRNGPVLLFTAHEWSAFVGSAQDGEFQLPRRTR